jgi:MFS family permease
VASSKAVSAAANPEARVTLDSPDTPVQSRSRRLAPWAALVAMALARITFAYQLQTVASLGPELRNAFGLEFATLGTLMGAYLLPGVLVAIPAGFLGRRFGDGTVIVAGMLLMVMGALFSAAAPASAVMGPVMIGVGRAVSGVGAVALTVLQPKAVADRFRGSRFNLAMGVLVGSFPIGIGLGQLTHHRLAEAFGWQAAFVAGAVLAAAGACLFLLGWRRVPGLPRGTGVAWSWPSRRELGLLVLSGLIWTAFNAGYFNFLGYLPSALAQRGHPLWMADLVLSIATWGNLPAILLGGLVAARFGAVRVFIAGAVLEVVAVAGMGVVDWPLVWGLLFGTLASVHAGIVVGWGALSARPENRAVGMGIFYTVYYLGGTIVPAICGWAADISGSASGAFLAAGALSALALPFWWWHRRMVLAAGMPA